MFKPLRYGSLYALIKEFDDSYKSYHHTLTDVNLGLPFSHNRASETPLQWKLMRISVENLDRSVYEHAISRYCKDCLLILYYYEAKGIYPEWCDKVYLSGRK